MCNIKDKVFTKVKQYMSCAFKVTKVKEFYAVALRTKMFVRPSSDRLGLIRVVAGQYFRLGIYPCSDALSIHVPHGCTYERFKT